VISLGRPYGIVCDIFRQALRKCVTSFGMCYGNLFENVRKALGKCV
jgi:hypothetical protein